MRYYIRVTDARLLDTLYASMERQHQTDRAHITRQGGFYILRTDDQALWQELFLYAQLLAQEQDAFVDGGEIPMT